MFLSSCEDVIEVDLNDAEPRLVIESSINSRVETGDVFGSIKLTTTSPFFSNDLPTVEDAIVEIRDESGIVFPFIHEGAGIYVSDFSPQESTEYTLNIIYNDEIYTATTSLISSVPLEYVEQRNDGGFSGDQIELKAFFQDPPNQENFYYFTANSERSIRRNVYSDEFYSGNLMFGSYSTDDLIVGDWVQFRLYGITEEFYNYMFILLQQTGGGGGPFETQPATVRGNIINETNPENYPLGYFRISQISVLNYQVE